MRAMRAEEFKGYKELKLVAVPIPAIEDGYERPLSGNQFSAHIDRSWTHQRHSRRKRGCPYTGHSSRSVLPKTS
jgi:hypothetical protein